MLIIGEHHTVRSPKYALTKNGVIVIGKNGVIAPWDDMITKYVALGCYFVSFDKKVSYLKTVVHNPTFPSKYDASLLDSLQYTYNKLSINGSVVFVPPTFEEDTIIQFVKSNIRYPMIALENNISGNVITSFLVNPDKSITDVRVEKSPDLALERESIRVLKRMNNLWNPGTIDGVAVPIEVKLIIRFSLSYD